MSRLLDKGAPATVEVQNRVKTRDASGARVYVNVGDRVPVDGTAEPVREWSAAEESQTLGMQVTNMLIFRSRKWPGDLNSHVAYEGHLYETVGVPQKFGMSRKTKHWRVTLKWIGTDGG